MYPESHLAITPQTLQGVPSYADITRRVLPSSDSQGVTGANPSAISDRPLQSRDRRPVNNPTIAAPASTPTTRPRTTRDSRDTNELDTAPETRSRDGQVSIAVLVLVILNSSLPLAASDSSRWGSR